MKENESEGLEESESLSTSHLELDTRDHAIRVFVRIRPLTPKERAISMLKATTVEEDSTIEVADIRHEIDGGRVSRA